MREKRVMRLHGTFIFIAFMALLFSSDHLNAEEQGPLSRFDEDQLKTLQAGEPVCVSTVTTEEGADPAGHGQCSIIVKAPMDKCFEIMEKIDQQVHWTPYKTRSKIVSRDDNKLLIDNEYVIYGVSIEYHSIYTIIEKKHRLEFEIDKSRPHDFEENSGFYQLEKIDGDKTLLTFGAYKLDVGFSVPTFVKNFLLGRSLPTMAINAKKYIESNGEWRQED